MSRSKSVKAFVCLLAACIIILTAINSMARVPLRSQWQWDRRLAFAPAGSQLSYNFAGSIAADGAGRVHLVWFDSWDGNAGIYYKRTNMLIGARPASRQR